MGRLLLAGGFKPRRPLPREPQWYAAVTRVKRRCRHWIITAPFWFNTCIVIPICRKSIYIIDFFKNIIFYRPFHMQIQTVVWKGGDSVAEDKFFLFSQNLGKPAAWQAIGVCIRLLSSRQRDNRISVQVKHGASLKSVEDLNCGANAKIAAKYGCGMRPNRPPAALQGRYSPAATFPC